MPETISDVAHSRSQSQRNTLLKQLGWAAVFLAPNFILVMLFTFIPAAGGLALSTAEWDVFSEPKFVGAENYVDLVDDDDFWIALRNTIVYTFTTVPVSIVLSLVLAIVLNEKLPGTLFFRTIFFIPVIMSGVLVSHTWQWLFNADYGPLNYFLWQIGIQGPRWLNDPRWSLVAVVIVTIWKSLGFNMIILLAGLQDVPRTFYDAAKIDGAGSWAEFRHVTLPMIAAPMFFAVVISIINSFQVFDIVYLMTNGGGPGRSSLVMVQYIYEIAFEYFEMGYASAIATVFFAIILFFTAAQWFSRRRWVYSEE